MGEYWLFVCVNSTTGEILMHLNPQSGFGGMKWGECISTFRGHHLLELLKNKFCPPGAVWAVVSDYGRAHYFPEGFNFKLLRNYAYEHGNVWAGVIFESVGDDGNWSYTLRCNVSDVPKTGSFRGAKQLFDKFRKFVLGLAARE